jgi:hypothetical protein
VYEQLADALDAFIAAVAGGEDLDEQGHADLMAALVEAVPSLPERQVQSLHDKLECAMQAVRVRQDQVSEGLSEIKGSKRALQGYDHIKPFDKEQRLYRRA